jgi:hypothetical protein
VKLLPAGSPASEPRTSLASVLYKHHWVIHTSMQSLQMPNVHPVSVGWQFASTNVMYAASWRMMKT